MLLRINESECELLATACASMQNELEKKAADPETNEDERFIALNNAGVWKRLHDAIREQITDFDRKQGAKMLD